MVMHARSRSVRWYREKKLQPGDRAPAWYLQDPDTELTHVRVQWVHPQHQCEGWYFVICNPPHLGRLRSEVGYDRIADAKAAASAWWKTNGKKHLEQFN